MMKDLIKDMSKYLPSHIVPAMVGLISIPILTRLFPPEQYGNYVLVMATVSVLTIIIGWLPMSIIRFYSIFERDSRLQEFYAITLKLGALSIAITFFIFACTLFFAKSLFSKDLYSLMRIGSLVFATTACFEFLQYFLRAKRRVGWYTIFSVWKSTASFGLGLALILVFRRGIEGLLWSAVLTSAMVLPILWKMSVENLPINTRSTSIDLTSQMAKYGFPLVAGNLAAWILNLSDRYILEFFRGTHEVGIYSASYNISGYSIMLLTSLFMMASGPIMMNVWEREGLNASQAFVNKLTRYYIIVCIPAVVGLTGLAKPIVSIFTSEEYYEGFRIFPFITLGIFFLGLQQRYQSGLLFQNKTYLIMIGILVSGLLNLTLNFLLVPKYGYMAAAFTTFISYGFLLFIISITSQRFFVWQFPFNTLLKVLCASGIMGLVVYFVGHSLSSLVVLNLIVAISVGLIVYLLLLLIFKEFSQQELKVFHLFKQKVPIIWKF